MLAEKQMMRETLAQQATKQTQPPEAPALLTQSKPGVGITSYAQNFEDEMLWRALGWVV